MTTDLAEWASEHGQIIKSGLLYGRREKFLPTVVGFAKDWFRFEAYLGNVGSLTVLSPLPGCHARGVYGNSTIPVRISPIAPLSCLHLRWPDGGECGVRAPKILLP